MAQEVSKGNYQLTPVDSRSKIFSENGREIFLPINHSLKPKKHLIIPLEFGFDRASMYHEKSDYIESDELIQENSKIKIGKAASGEMVSKFIQDRNWLRKIYFEGLKTLKKLVGNNSELNFDLDSSVLSELTIEKNIGREFLDKTSSLDDLKRLLPRRFAIGSFFSINEILTNDGSITIPSPADNPMILMSAVYSGGSCPYLTKFLNHEWVDTGAILVGRRAKLLETTEERDVSAATKVRLEEREAEVSYIDQIGFHYTLPNGQEQFVSIEDPDLKEKDGKYKKLYQGESIEVDLHGLVPSDAQNVRFSITGYYEPLPNKKIR
jgi:hypothetical protein